MTRRLPAQLQIELGPPQVSGPSVGPGDPYLSDCWVAVLGATQVVAYERLHSLVGSTVAAAELAGSVGLVSSKWVERFGFCLDRLEDYTAVRLEDGVCLVSPGLRYLTRRELERAGPLVQAAHRSHLAERHLEFGRLARLAAEAAHAQRRPRTVAVRLGVGS